MSFLKLSNLNNHVESRCGKEASPKVSTKAIKGVSASKSRPRKSAIMFNKAK